MTFFDDKFKHDDSSDYPNHPAFPCITAPRVQELLLSGQEFGAREHQHLGHCTQCLSMVADEVMRDFFGDQKNTLDPTYGWKDGIGVSLFRRQAEKYPRSIMISEFPVVSEKSTTLGLRTTSLTLLPQSDAACCSRDNEPQENIHLSLHSALTPFKEQLWCVAFFDEEKTPVSARFIVPELQVERGKLHANVDLGLSSELLPIHSAALCIVAESILSEEDLPLVTLSYLLDVGVNAKKSWKNWLDFLLDEKNGHTIDPIFETFIADLHKKLSTESTQPLTILPNLNGRGITVKGLDSMRFNNGGRGSLN